MTPPRPAAAARRVGLVALALAIGGCSLFFEPEAVPFRSVAQGATSQPFGSPLTAQTAEQEAGLRGALEIAAFEPIDYETTTLIALGTLGGCPNTSYRIAVTDVDAQNGGVVISAEVTASRAGGDAITYPFDVIAIDDLASYGRGDRSEVRITTSVERSGDCRFF